MIVILPWPDRRLSPNARVHWSEKAEAARKYRHDAVWIAMEAAGRAFEASDDVSAMITFIPPDGRRRDTDNMIASIKSGLDGIADAIGIDDSKWKLSIRREEPKAPGSVKVEITT